MPQKKTIIQIAGPTAVGKTALAITLAKEFNTEILSFDSRQCYRELSIGVARPSIEQLTEVPHHFIASHSVEESLNAAWYEQYALEQVKTIFQQYDVLVMVGGTGLYWKAFAEGLDLIPAIDPSIRTAIIKGYEQGGMEWLTAELLQRDPSFAAAYEMKNPQRMMRALEVVMSSGQSILSFQKNEKKDRAFNIISVGLELPRHELVHRINQRTIQMMEEGLLQEVSALTSLASLNALQTVGYSELFAYLANEYSLEEAIERIQINTRQYAKRQMTWFKRDTSMFWFAPTQGGEIIQMVQQRLN
jgi:tRNA dimethylallyltransferase